MVLLGLALLAGFITLVAWLCTYAWGSRAVGWPEDRTPSRWRYVPYAAASALGVLAILYVRALPALLLFLVATRIVFGARHGIPRRCRNCGDTLDRDADTCGNCGTSIR